MLNSPQKIALEVDLRRLERTLLQARQWLMEPPADGLLTFYRPLPEASRADLEALIEQMLAQIAVLVERFRLAPEVEDLGRNLEAELVAAWADMTDTLSPKLVRYGAVDSTLVNTLDPSLHHLMDWSRQVCRLALQPAGASSEDRINEQST